LAAKSRGGEKSVDSAGNVFYYLLYNGQKGGDPGVSVTLVYPPEILKPRHPEGLGKALDSEAEQG
jgi:hypothetical protein